MTRSAARCAAWPSWRVPDSARARIHRARHGLRRSRQHRAGGLPHFRTAAEIIYFCTNQVFAMFFVTGRRRAHAHGAHLAPEMATQFFGLFALSGTVTAFLAPFMVATTTSFFESQRAGFASLASLMVLGALVLMRVREERVAVRTDASPWARVVGLGVAGGVIPVAMSLSLSPGHLSCPQTLQIALLLLRSNRGRICPSCVGCHPCRSWISPALRRRYADFFHVLPGRCACVTN